MAFIQDIDITVSNLTTGVQQQSFKLPLIMGTHSTTAEAYTEYANLAAVAVDYPDTEEEYDMAATLFAQTPTLEKIAITRKLDATSWATALSTLILTENDWYALLITSKAKADLNAVGTWANSNKKRFFGCTSDITALTGVNLAREAYFLTSVSVDRPDAAIAGKVLGYTPGTYDVKWQTLSGISDSGFSLTDLNTIRSNQGNAPSEVGGRVFMNDGVSTDGSNIATGILIDYCVSRIESALLLLFLNNLKISMDSRGLAQIESTITGELQALAAVGAIAEVDTTSEADMAFSEDGKYLYKVTVPTRSQIPANDRANGIVPNVVASFYVSGAVKEIQINLNVLI